MRDFCRLKGGIRSTYVRTRRDYTNGGIFGVRYWSLASIRTVFDKNIGPSNLIGEAFGGLGLLTEDRNYVSAKAKVLIGSYIVTPLIWLADSVYVVSVKR
jgi:hypothetical protein